MTKGFHWFYYELAYFFVLFNSFLQNIFRVHQEQTLGRNGLIKEEHLQDISFSFMMFITLKKLESCR